MNSAAYLALSVLCFGATACLGATEGDEEASLDAISLPGSSHILPIRNPEVSSAPPEQASASITTTSPSGALLVDYGGPVLTNVNVIPIYWTSGVAYQTELNAFYSAVPSSDFYDMLGQYDVGRGTYGTPFVSSQTATTLTDSAIQTALKSMFQAGQVALPSSNNYYPIHFPSGVSITDSSGTKSCVKWCAYHGTFKYNGVNVNYGVIPDQGGGCAGGCGLDSLRVNNLTSVSSHELVEATTDPAVSLASSFASPLAWYDSINGEVGDICNGQQATILGSDGQSYVVQREFSNLDNNCAWWSEPNALTNQVLVYGDPNYAGDAQALYPGDYSGSTLTIGNDTLSSLRIPSGWTVTLYADTTFSGSSLTLTSDTAALSAKSFDNLVSSIRVTGPSQSFPVIYKDSNYGGASQTLRPGVYNWSGELTIGNDAVSSISVPSGWSVTLYKNANFGGSSVTYTSSASSLGSFNDETTSIKVTGPSAYQTPVVIYKDASYTGAGQALWPGHYTAGNLTIGNDELSSLTIPSGWKVYLIKDAASKNSAMKVYTSSQSSLSGDGYNDVTSEIVVVGPS